ncbi:MAG: class II aldolase/adducin family protein [Clostridiales bacterium]|nr:class II aldolase/adducin family protein [Clostridiales bacterium]
MKLLYEKEREEICDVCHKLWQRGIVAANDGNVSVKLADGTVLCTPSGVSKSAMTPEILVHLSSDGNVILAAEGYRPSSEMKMHFRCYAERPDVSAVVHAHPPIATSYASMGRALDGYHTAENIVNLGAVPVAPYAKPSTDQVPDSIAPFLREHDAVLLAHHGALTVGDTLTRAYFRMESLEMYAKTSLYIHLLGGAPDMDREQIDELLDLRVNGYKMPGRHPGYVKYNDDTRVKRS